MDDRKLNPLRLALLVSIALYFASVGLRLPTKNPSETIPQATQAPLVQPQIRIDGCHAHISEATASTRELPEGERNRRNPAGQLRRRHDREGHRRSMQWGRVPRLYPRCPQNYPTRWLPRHNPALIAIA